MTSSAPVGSQSPSAQQPVLQQSTPADGAVELSGPYVVELRFDRAPGAVKLQLTGPAGEVRLQPLPSTSPGVLQATVIDAQPAGEWSLTWQSRAGQLAEGAGTVRWTTTVAKGPKATGGMVASEDSWSDAHTSALLIIAAVATAGCIFLLRFRTRLGRRRHRVSGHDGP